MFGSFKFDNISQALADAKGSGVSFESQAKKWENEEQANDLIEAINNCKSLQFLNLEGNSLGVDAARGIGKALEKHPEFQQALFKDLFTGRLKTEIPQALELMGKGMNVAGAHLQILDCSDNALGPNGMVGLVELLKSPTCYSLQELKLNNCGLGIGGGKMLAQALLDCHAASVAAGTPLQLKVFIAGRNRLENDGAKALAQVFEKVKTLEMVAMPQNGIYHPGISALSDGFKVNPNMKTLNLNDNTIGPIGAEAIADALVSMQNLIEINFGDCLLKTRGALTLGEALQDGHLALETLNLGFNEIGPNGAYAIVSAMYNKDQLQSLNLNGNQFGEECREGIREMLEEQNRLHALEELDEDDSDAEDEDDDDDEVGDGDDDEDDEDDDAETYEADESENYQDVNQSINFNSTGPISLNWTLGSMDGNSIIDDTIPLTTESFCNIPIPSSSQFAVLKGDGSIEAFRKYLKSLPEHEYLLNAVFTAMKLASVAKKQSDALSVACSLLGDIYDHAAQTNQVTRVNNFFLTQLGLLKNEDKSFAPAYDRDSCRFVFNHAINDVKALPKEVASTYSLFLNQFPMS